MSKYFTLKGAIRRTVYKRNGKYYCQFMLNGYRVHKLLDAYDYKEARYMEDKLKFEILDEIHTKCHKKEKVLKMTRLYNLYFDYSRLNKRSHKSDCVLLGIVKKYFKDMLVYNVTPNILEQFKDYLLHIRKVKASTVNRYFALLSKMFNLAIDNELTDKNPVKSIKKLRENNYKIRFLTKTEEDSLYSVLKYSPKYLADIVTTALQTGMRKGEILNLKWDDIDFEFGFIEVLETKSGKPRRIPISSKLKQVLDNIPRTCDYVFNISGEKIGDIKKCWNTAIRNAGITNFRFHDLRHTAATRMLEKGVDIVTVKEILGHADISTTMRYVHTESIRKKFAIEILAYY